MVLGTALSAVFFGPIAIIWGVEDAVRFGQLTIWLGVYTLYVLFVLFVALLATSTRFAVLDRKSFLI